MALNDVTGIIGAGPSGLAASLFLQGPCEVLESAPQVGGHAASFEAQGFTFDYGPHILFSRDAEILGFLTGILGSNVSRCRRNNKISFRGHLLKYPFENDLASLPREDNYACLHGFVFNPYKEKYSAPANMREWLLKKFGEGICSRYLFPYNEKVWNLPVAALSPVLAERIPDPPPEDILKSSLGFDTEGYLHQLYYYYPTMGGYQAISECLARAANIKHGFHVASVECTGNGIRVIAENGAAHEYSRLISTMPVHELVKKMVNPVPDEIRLAVESLIVNPMFVISFGLSGVDARQFTAVYIADAELLVNRVSYPCTFSAKNAPEGHYSLQAEITCARDSQTWQMSDEAILAHTREGLQKRGLLPDDAQIVLQRVDRKERSYVVYDLGFEQRAQKVRNWFSARGIHLLGRFGYFEYINVDMAVNHALSLAFLLNGESDVDCPGQHKSASLSRARELLLSK